MTQMVKPHVRYCHGCGLHDDAPRVHYAVDGDPANDRLFHNDAECLPPEAITPENQAIVDARAAGTKDDDLREVAVSHAQSLQEAPADKIKGK